MTKTCDICGKSAEPMQGLYGAPGDGGRTGPRVGSARHYQCHIDTHGKPYSGTMTGLFNDIRRAHDIGLGAVAARINKPVKNPIVTKGEHNRSENAGRTFTMHSIINEMGRKRGRIDCPFCNLQFTAYVWSISGGGKKCPNCGAMHASFGIAYPITGNEDM